MLNRDLSVRYSAAPLGKYLLSEGAFLFSPSDAAQLFDPAKRSNPAARRRKFGRKKALPLSTYAKCGNGI